MTKYDDRTILILTQKRVTRKVPELGSYEWQTYSKAKVTKILMKKCNATKKAADRYYKKVMDWDKKMQRVGR